MSSSSLKKEEDLETYYYYPPSIRVILLGLEQDAFFQTDLDASIVKTAIQHWTNEKRLSNEQALKLNDQYQVKQVLMKLRHLQAECKRLDMKMPPEALQSVKTREKVAKTKEARVKGTQGDSKTVKEEAVPEKQDSKEETTPIIKTHKRINKPRPFKRVISFDESQEFPTKTKSDRVKPTYLDGMVDMQYLVQWWGVQFFVIGAAVAFHLRDS